MINKLKAWCNKVLPLVYDDSLSYYELLCKVIHKMNEMIENINDHLSEYIQENLPDIFTEVMYNRTNKRITLIHGDNPVSSGDEANNIEIGDNIINLRDESARSSIASLNTSVAANTAKSTLSQQVNYAGKDIVFFGDSWTVGAHVGYAPNRFSSRIAAAFKMNERNFGVGASGFSRVNNAIITQVNTAISQMTAAERAAVPLVVVVGGVNDIRTMADTTLLLFCQAVSDCMDRINTGFPNALIVAVVGNTEVHGTTKTQLHWLTSGQEFACYAKSYPVLVCRGCENWIRNHPNLYLSDGLHPNERGHGVFASYIMNAICGGNTEEFDFLDAIIFNEELVSVTLTPHLFSVGPLIVVTGGYVTFLTEITELTEVGEIDPLMAPVDTTYIPLYRGNKVDGAMAITRNGDVFVMPQTTPLGTAFVGTGFWMMY